MWREEVIRVSPSNIVDKQYILYIRERERGQNFIAEVLGFGAIAYSYNVSLLRYTDIQIKVIYDTFKTHTILQNSSNINKSNTNGSKQH